MQNNLSPNNSQRPTIPDSPETSNVAETTNIYKAQQSVAEQSKSIIRILKFIDAIFDPRIHQSILKEKRNLVVCALEYVIKNSQKINEQSERIKVLRDISSSQEEIKQIDELEAIHREKLIMQSDTSAQITKKTQSTDACTQSPNKKVTPKVKAAKEKNARKQKTGSLKFYSMGYKLLAAVNNVYHNGKSETVGLENFNLPFLDPAFKVIDAKITLEKITASEGYKNIEIRATVNVNVQYPSEDGRIVSGRFKLDSKTITLSFTDTRGIKKLLKSTNIVKAGFKVGTTLVLDSIKRIAGKKKPKTTDPKTTDLLINLLRPDNISLNNFTLEGEIKDKTVQDQNATADFTVLADHLDYNFEKKCSSCNQMYINADSNQYTKLLPSSEIYLPGIKTEHKENIHTISFSKVYGDTQGDLNIAKGEAKDLNLTFIDDASQTPQKVTTICTVSKLSADHCNLFENLFSIDKSGRMSVEEFKLSATSPKPNRTTAPEVNQFLDTEFTLKIDQADGDLSGIFNSAGQLKNIHMHKLEGSACINLDVIQVNSEQFGFPGEKTDQPPVVQNITKQLDGINFPGTAKNIHLEIYPHASPDKPFIESNIETMELDVEGFLGMRPVDTKNTLCKTLRFTVMRPEKNKVQIRGSLNDFSCDAKMKILSAEGVSAKELSFFFDVFLHSEEQQMSPDTVNQKNAQLAMSKMIAHITSPVKGEIKQLTFKSPYTPDVTSDNIEAREFNLLVQTDFDDDSTITNINLKKINAELSPKSISDAEQRLKAFEIFNLLLKQKTDNPDASLLTPSYLQESEEELLPVSEDQTSEQSPHFKLDGSSANLRIVTQKYQVSSRVVIPEAHVNKNHTVKNLELELDVSDDKANAQIYTDEIDINPNADNSCQLKQLCAVAEIPETKGEFEAAINAEDITFKLKDPKGIINAHGSIQQSGLYIRNSEGKTEIKVYTDEKSGIESEKVESDKTARENVITIDIITFLAELMPKYETILKTLPVESHFSINPDKNDALTGKLNVQLEGNMGNIAYHASSTAQNRGTKLLLRCISFAAQLFNFNIQISDLPFTKGRISIKDLIKHLRINLSFRGYLSFVLYPLALLMQKMLGITLTRQSFGIKKLNVIDTEGQLSLTKFLEQQNIFMTDQITAKSDVFSTLSEHFGIRSG